MSALHAVDAPARAPGQVPVAAHKRDAPLLALVGPWLANKGDALMQAAVLQHYATAVIGSPTELQSKRGPRPQLTPLARQPDVKELGDVLRQAKLSGAARLIGKGLALSLPPAISFRLAGRIAAHHAAGVIDCSGFGYGDGWSIARVRTRETYYRALKARGMPIVFLPQAFGPFRKEETRTAVRRLLGLADLIFARDEDSLEHLRTLDLPDSVEIALAPDITHGVDGTAPADAAAWRRRVALTPNVQMLRMASPSASAAYAEFMLEAASAVEAHGLEPWFVLHETHDGALADMMNTQRKRPIPVLDAAPLLTKGVLGACHAVIGSRFHAMVSALSQAVPALTTSWSHKYERLFADYGIADLVVAPDGPRDLRVRALDLVLDPKSRAQIADRIRPVGASKRAELAQTWRRADQALKLDTTNAPRGDAS